MKEKGISRLELSRRIGASPAAITNLFDVKTKSTRLKPLIHKALDLVVPKPERAIAKTDALSRLMRAWPDLTEEERAHLVTTAEMIRAKR